MGYAVKRAIVKAHLAMLAAEAAPRTLDDICQRCGQCCYHKAQVGTARVFMPRSRCPHLADDRVCSRYQTRLQVPTCLPLAEALVRELMPDTCPYASGLVAGGYRGPRVIRQ